MFVYMYPSIFLSIYLSLYPLSMHLSIYLMYGFNYLAINLFYLCTYACMYLFRSMYLCIMMMVMMIMMMNFLFPQSSTAVVRMICFSHSSSADVRRWYSPQHQASLQEWRDHGVLPCGGPREYPWRPPHGSQAVARTLLLATTIGQSLDSGTAHTWRALPRYPDRRPRPTHPRNSSTACGRASSSLDAGASVQLEQELVSDVCYSLCRKYIKPKSILDDK